MVGAPGALKVGFTSLYIIDMIKLHFYHFLEFFTESDVV